jgi:hypothetical protein
VEDLDNPLVTQTHDYAPAQIVAFVVSPEANETVSPHIMAVVNTCSFLHKKDSIFSTIRQHGFDDAQQAVPSLVLVNVDYIVRHCLMIPTDKEHGCYQEIWHRERWADEFFKCEAK